MSRFGSLALRLSLGLSLTLAGGALLASGCTPPSSKPAPKKSEKAPPKDLPKDPWLEGVVAKAEVSVTGKDGKTVACKWNASKKRHLCPNQESWVYVGPQVLKVGGKDEVCVWQHPVEGGVVTTKLKGIATQPLELRHAFAGAAAGVKEAAPVQITLRIDGQERAKTQRVRKPGFDKVRLEPAASGKPGDLEIQVSASHAGVAHFCWQLARLPNPKPVAALPNGLVPGEPSKAASATPDVKAASAKPADDKAGAAKETPKEEPKAAGTAESSSEEPRAAKPRLRSRLNGRLPNGAVLKPAVPLKALRKAPITGD